MVRPAPAIIVLALAVQLAIPLQKILAKNAPSTPPPNFMTTAPACGAFPVPDFAPAFVPPIHDYMSFRSWFVHQPGATTVGQIYVPNDAVAWPYRGTDSITFTRQGMRTYQLPNGRDRVSAYYDPHTSVVGVLEQCGTASIYVVVRAKDAPAGLPTVEHVSQITDKGVVLGMTLG